MTTLAAHDDDDDDEVASDGGGEWPVWGVPDHSENFKSDNRHWVGEQREGNLLQIPFTRPGRYNLKANSLFKKTFKYKKYIYIVLT